MEVSGLSHWDYINLVGHYHKLSEGDLIDPQLYDRGYTEAQIKHMEQEAKKQKVFGSLRSLNLKYDGSLENFEYPHFNYIMTIHNQYKVGMLPFYGALSDQPAQVIDAVSVIEQLQHEVDKRERDKAERERKRVKNRPR